MISYTEFGGLYDYNKTRSFDGRAFKTNYDNAKANSNYITTNENVRYYTTGFKNDYMENHKKDLENKVR